jgi:hypothetical protein
MKLKLSKVDCSRGAPMGRSSSNGSEEPIKFRLERMDLTQGYDNGGAYWGEGPPAMYYAKGEDNELVHEFFTRATSRDEAKEKVRESFPKATFYR